MKAHVIKWLIPKNSIKLCIHKCLPYFYLNCLQQVSYSSFVFWFSAASYLKHMTQCEILYIFTLETKIVSFFLLSHLIRPNFLSVKTIFFIITSSLWEIYWDILEGISIHLNCEICDVMQRKSFKAKNSTRLFLYIFLFRDFGLHSARHFSDGEMNDLKHLFFIFFPWVQQLHRNMQKSIKSELNAFRRSVNCL